MWEGPLVAMNSVLFERRVSIYLDIGGRAQQVGHGFVQVRYLCEALNNGQI